jgi:predicted GNAT superfamily acetyltransferase
MDFHVRTAAEKDFDAILRLNEAEIARTSAMDAEGLARFAAMADMLDVVESDGRVVAFLLALREGAPYANDNFAWFSARYPRFLYVDRIVVDATQAGRGIGAALYRRLFERARADAVPVVVCEYNLEPPNPASAAFHARFGFTEVGQRTYADGLRRVSMQAAPA